MLVSSLYIVKGRPNLSSNIDSGHMFLAKRGSKTKPSDIRWHNHFPHYSTVIGKFQYKVELLSVSERVQTPYDIRMLEFV